jgi:DNA-binding beta-propeller fold protein YncE
MGASELIDVDVHAHAVVRTLPNLPDVHGVIVVPDKHRVYATATGANQVVAIDEVSGAVLFRAPTDTYPDGLAYDPSRRTVWTTNETAGTETVIDADTGAVRATVPLGGEAGNVVYDRLLDQMVVAVQSRNHLAVIGPVSFTVTERIPTPGCDHPHGLALDVTNQVMFVGCEANATIVTVDLVNRAVIDRHGVGETPDVLAYDPGANRVYVAAESGWVSIFDHDHGHLTVRGSAYLADGRTHWLSTPRRTTATFQSPRTTTVHQCCGSTNPPDVAAPPPTRIQVHAAPRQRRQQPPSARRTPQRRRHRYG